MKNITRMAIGIGLCLMLTSCGSKGTAKPAEHIEEATPVPVVSTNSEETTLPEEAVVPEAVSFTFDHFDVSAEAKEYAVIKAFDKSGELLWCYETDHVYVGMNDTVQDIGCIENRYYLIVDGSVVCLDKQKGQLLWKNDELKGQGCVFDFNEDGDLYIAGYSGPLLMGIDKNGITLFRYEEIPQDWDYELQGCYWPSELEILEDGCVRILYMSNMRYLVIDPAVYEPIDWYDYVMPIDPAELVGSWKDTGYPATMMVDIDETLNFTAYHMDETGFVINTYSGVLRCDIFSPQTKDGIDRISFVLEDTNDPKVEGWNSMGDYLIQGCYEWEGKSYLSLKQLNNGEGLFTLYADNFFPVLQKVEVLG